MVDRPPVHGGVPTVEARSMTQIQQIQWKLEMDYIGHPYYVSRNAIYHALAAELDYETSQHLRASHGMFVPGDYSTVSYP
jgi:hypothetical protein